MINLFCWASTSGGHPEKGNQTGKELKVAPWYFFGQTDVIRWKNKENGKECARISKILCKNKSIGYSQDDRYSLFILASKCGWNIDKLLTALKTTKVNTDCSQLACVCVNLTLQREKVHDWYTGSMVGIAKNLPLYFTTFKYVKGYKTQKGDFEVAPNKHTIINC